MIKGFNYILKNKHVFKLDAWLKIQPFNGGGGLQLDRFFLVLDLVPGRSIVQKSFSNPFLF